MRTSPAPAASADKKQVNVRAVVTTSLALIMAVLDGAIANIALPSITSDFHISPADSIWVVNSYQMAVLVLLLPLGSLGEILGYRRIYTIGLGVFTIASLACAFSPSLPALVLARIVQGLGAAAIMSVNAGLLRVIYPPGQLGRGLGINALVVALASALGPTLASGLLSVGPWPILFAVNVPLGLMTLWIGRGALPTTALSERRFDWPSALLNGVTLVFAVIAIDGLGGRQPWIQVAAELATAAVFGAFLLARQFKQTAPLVPIDLLSIRIFRLSVMASIFGFGAATLALVSLPFYFQHALGYSAVETGLLMTPWPLALALVAPIAGRLSDRHSPGLLGAIGLSLVCAGLLLLGLTGGANPLTLAAKLAICGIGFGLFQAPNNRAMLTAAPPDRGGAAGGLLSTARLLGQSCGAAAAAVSLAATSGPSEALLIGAGLGALGALISRLR